MDKGKERSPKRTFSKLCDDNDFLSENSRSRKITQVEQYPDESIHQYFRPDDFARCSLTKVVQIAEPILTKFADCITENKANTDTLETHALKQMTRKLLERNFTKEQISGIKKSRGFVKLDLTLKIRWIEVFIDFNTKLNKNKDLNAIIINTLKRLKTVRNDLCHNRKHYTKSQCFDIAHNFKVVLIELLEIMRTWDLGMDILAEKNKIKSEINEIMKGNISKEDFNYMRLQTVLNHVVEPVLNTVVKLICCNKIEDNFLDYFARNGMNSKKIKDAFYKEEKIALENKSVRMKLDVTLCTKIIEICKEWHDILAYDVRAKGELSNIIREIRDIRNYISHNILSIPPEDCTRKANKLGYLLEDLAKFAHKTKLYAELDVPVINIEQNYIDIKSIMSLPHPCS